MTAHLQQLRQDGYVVFQLLSPLEAQLLKEHVQGLESDGVGSPSEVQHRIAQLIPAGGNAIARLVCHPTLLEILHGFLGPKCRCATFSSNTLLHQGTTSAADGSLDSGLGWHVDYPYHDIDPPWPPPEFPLGCQVLICLDEFRADNGGTMFMPNSHKQKPDGLEEDQDGTFPGSTILAAPAGSVLVAHSGWWHRQTKNVSSMPRAALLGNYTPGHVVPKDNMEKQWHLLEEAGQLQLLPETDRKNLERLLLGPYKRGLYRGDPQYGNVLT